MSNKIRKANYGICVFALSVVMIGTGAQSNAETKKIETVSECATIIKKPGSYRLSQNLDGCEDFGIAILTQNVDLDLGGHNISCTPPTGVDTAGIILSTSGAVIRPDDPGSTFRGNSRKPFVKRVSVTNGSVTGCIFGVFGERLREFEISEISAQQAFFAGITLVEVEDGLVADNTVTQSGPGILTFGTDDTVYARNVMTGNFAGFDVIDRFDESSGNQFLCNVANGNARAGIALVGAINDGVVRGNITDGNGIGGLGLVARPLEPGSLAFTPIPRGNLVTGNSSIGNGAFDLIEAELDDTFVFTPIPGCLNNFNGNTYGTSIAGAACIPPSEPAGLDFCQSLDLDQYLE